MSPPSLALNTSRNFAFNFWWIDPTADAGASPYICRAGRAAATQDGENKTTRVGGMYIVKGAAERITDLCR